MITSHLSSPVWLSTKIFYLLCINSFYWNNQRNTWWKYGCGIFVYLQKIFDTVNHSILIGKLEHYGIRGVAYSWFESYLKGRKQYVSINGFNSKDLPISYGVP